MSTTAARCRGESFRSASSTSVRSSTRSNASALPGGPTQSPRGSPEPSAPVPFQVEGRPVEIAERIGVGADPMPPFPDPEERLLHELLRFAPITRHQAQRPVQAHVMLPEERLEARLRFDLLFVDGGHHRARFFDHSMKTSPRSDSFKSSGRSSRSTASAPADPDRLAPEIEQVLVAIQLQPVRVSSVPEHDVERRGVAGHHELRIAFDRIGLGLQGPTARTSPASSGAHPSRAGPSNAASRRRASGPAGRRTGAAARRSRPPRTSEGNPVTSSGRALGVDPMDRRLVGLTARPERQRRRRVEERPRLQVGRSRRERLHQGSMAVSEPCRPGRRPPATHPPAAPDRRRAAGHRRPGRTRWPIDARPRHV